MICGALAGIRPQLPDDAARLCPLPCRPGGRQHLQRPLDMCSQRPGRQPEAYHRRLVPWQGLVSQTAWRDRPSRAWCGACSPRPPPSPSPCCCLETEWRCAAASERASSLRQGVAASACGLDRLHLHCLLPGARVCLCWQPSARTPPRLRRPCMLLQHCCMLPWRVRLAPRCRRPSSWEAWSLWSSWVSTLHTSGCGGCCGCMLGGPPDTKRASAGAYDRPQPRQHACWKRGCGLAAGNSAAGRLLPRRTLIPL